MHTITKLFKQLQKKSYVVYALIFSFIITYPANILAGSLLNHGLFDDTDNAPQALGKMAGHAAPILYTLSLVMMILGGVTMFVSIGNAARYEQGKKMIIAAFTGAFAMSAFWIILSFMGINFK
ncbi:MAG: hypothetical protein WCP14_02555 [bacterium]